MVGFTISVEGYTMHLIQVDGGSEVAEAKEAASVGIVYPGERVDIVVERIPWFAEGNPVIRIEMDDEYDSVCNTIREIALTWS
jgi:hypothetical protein